MPRATELLSQLDADRFAEVIAASPKKFREEIYRRAGIRSKPGGAFAIKTSAKNEVRAQKLQTALKDGAPIEDPLAEELIRNYFYTRREMLASALDYFQIEHDHGLTDADLDFMAELEPEKVTALRAHLATQHDAADVDLYLAFMNVGAS